MVDLFTENGGNQMNHGMIKRICALALVAVLSCGFSTSAFAAESIETPIQLTQVSSEDNVAEISTDEIVPYANPVVTGSVPAWSNRTYTVHLNSYLGLTKTFRATTQCSGSGGGIDIVVKKGNKYISDGNWWMGVNDTGDWKVTLPSSGDYSVQVINNSDHTVYVTLQWL